MPKLAELMEQANQAYNTWAKVVEQPDKLYIFGWPGAMDNARLNVITKMAQMETALLSEPVSKL